MMENIFDTHKAVERLQASGAEKPLAEALVATIGEARNSNTVTKDYLTASLYKMALTIVLVNVTLTVSLTVSLIKLLP